MMSQLVNVEYPAGGASTSGDAESAVARLEHRLLVQLNFEVRHPTRERLANVDLVERENGKCPSILLLLGGARLFERVITVCFSHKIHVAILLQY